MAMKVTVIKMTFIEDKYRVDSVTDSTSPNPGDTLTKAQVDGYCSSKWFKVIINRSITR